MRNKNINPLDSNLNPVNPSEVPERFVVDVGESLYDKVGNKFGIVSWRFDHDKDTWMITRANHEVEYYKTKASFESLTQSDLKELIRVSYVDSQTDGKGWTFFRKLEREVKDRFSTMKWLIPI
ncbi:hypothetical protein Hanom_Chr04g00346121 [Helianthus anomalus]